MFKVCAHVSVFVCVRERFAICEHGATFYITVCLVLL